MASDPRRRPLTPEEYLRWESVQDERHEYEDGEIVALAGATKNHERIATSLLVAIAPHVRARGCDVFKGDTKVQPPLGARYYYPDIVVTCDARDLLAGGGDGGSDDVVRYPQLIIEVLSERTARRDLTTKFRAYRSIPTLQEYVVVDSREIGATTFRRGEDGEWSQVAFTDPPSALTLASIGLDVPLAALYERVTIDMP
jgi:Uma2 family endonuclease